VLSLTPCFGQTTPSESQALQALLLEVRQLRQDLQTTTIAVQRAQILLCLPKMLSGANAFEISNLREAETEKSVVRRAECNNVTLR
jgi:hypothetical protein